MLKGRICARGVWDAVIHSRIRAMHAFDNSCHATHCSPLTMQLEPHVCLSSPCHTVTLNLPAMHAHTLKQDANWRHHLHLPDSVSRLAVLLEMPSVQVFPLA